MYPKNAASPPRIAVGSIYLIANGSKVVADASVVVRAEGGAEAGGAGTLVVGATSGIWYYTPTQAETNYTAFTVTVYKADCTTATVTVVTTESAVAGRVSLGSILGTAPTETTTGWMAGAFTKFFDIETPTGTVNSLPDAVPGAENGVFIAGTNAATTITTSGGSAALTIVASGADKSGVSITGAGDGIDITGTNGAGLDIDGAAGITVNGSSQDAVNFSSDGGNGDGLQITGNGSGADIKADIQGSLSGSVASVTTKTGYELAATGANLILKDSTFALAIADAICDELLEEHTTADTVGLVLNELQDGGRLDLLLDDILEDTGMTLPDRLTGIEGATFDTDDDSLEAIRNRGDAAWTTTDPGLGAHTVTVTVDDGDGTALESASVRYTKGALTYVLATDSSGNATFNLDSGEWTVAVSLAGYTYSGTTHTFSADDTATYSMTAISISAPSDVSLCTVQFQVKLGNTAVEGAVCKAKLLGTNVAADGVVLSNAEHSATTDSDGLAKLELVRSDQIVKGNKLYGFWVTYNGITIAQKQCEIPAQATAYFEDLL